jgi:hypothetical protein
VLLHGILCGQTVPGWQDRFEQWLWRNAAGVHVIKRRYHAGPFPLWNVFLKNHYLAAKLAAELEPFAQDGAEIHFVSHSNGADVAVKTMRRLAKRGHVVKSAIFVAGAISADIGRAGLYDLYARGVCTRFFSYSAPDDWVLRFPVVWPNGYLGRLGFRFGLGDWWQQINPIAAREDARGDGFFNRWFKGGHTNYWQPAQELQTFRQLWDDLCPVPF